MEILQHVDTSSPGDQLLLLLSLPLVFRSSHSGVRSLRHALLSLYPTRSKGISQTLTQEVKWLLTANSENWDTVEILLGLLLQFDEPVLLRDLTKACVVTARTTLVRAEMWARVLAFSKAVEDEDFTHWAAEALRDC